MRRAPRARIVRRLPHRLQPRVRRVRHLGPRRPGRIRLHVAAHPLLPFCGTELPESRRDEWFDRIEDLELEAEAAPKEMLDYGWWLAVSD